MALKTPGPSRPRYFWHSRAAGSRHRARSARLPVRRTASNLERAGCASRCAAKSRSCNSALADHGLRHLTTTEDISTKASSRWTAAGNRSARADALQRSQRILFSRCLPALPEINLISRRWDKGSAGDGCRCRLLPTNPLRLALETFTASVRKHTVPGYRWGARRISSRRLTKRSGTRGRWGRRHFEQFTAAGYWPGRMRKLSIDIDMRAALQGDW